jgi:UDP:flavonoid glycosyltransferase YjiC (YdhE family)
VCSAPSFRIDVEAFGVTHIDAGLDWLMSDQSTYDEFPPMPPPGPEFPQWVVTTLADVTTRRMAPDLLEIAAEWKPDLIVREAMEYSGCLAAERLGIAHASVASNAYAALDSPEVNYFPGNRLMVSEPMARHREQLGLPPDPEVRMPFRHLHMCFTPPAWDGADAPRPANTRFLRHVSAASTEAVPPDWLDALPDRPTALASLGTVFNRTPDVLEAIVDALADEPVNLIVAIGRDEDPERFGAHPDNVRLEPYVPQPLVLERSGAFVTHGGFNSVKEALSAGVPMVVVPITADQRYSAERCAALGVGRWIRPDERGPEAIRDAAREVLAEPSYRARASEFQAEMNALPGPRSGSSCSRRWRGPARRRFSRAHAACAGATPPPAGPRQPACPR